MLDVSRFSAKDILFQRAVQRARLVVATVSLVGGISGVAAAVVWLFFSHRPDTILDQSFFLQSHPQLLMLSVSLLVALFGFLHFLLKKSNNEQPTSFIMAAEDAFLLASSRRQAITAEHVALVALQDSSVQLLLVRLLVSLPQWKKMLQDIISVLPVGVVDVVETGELQSVVQDATALAKSEGRSPHTLDLFAAAYRASPPLQRLLTDMNITEEMFFQALRWMLINEQLRARALRLRQAAGEKPQGAMNRTMTATATPTLAACSEDLTLRAVYGGMHMLIGRTSQLEQIFRVFTSGRGGVILVGDNGVGVSAIVEGLANCMVEEDVPELLFDKRLLSIDVQYLVTQGESARTQLLFALREAAGAGNIVLALEHIDVLVEERNGEFAALVASELERSKILLLCTTHPAGFARLEKSPLARVLTKVLVNEPDRQDAISIVESHVGDLEHRHHVAFSLTALVAAVDLGKKYIHDSPLPQSALLLCAEAAAAQAAQKQRQWILPEDIATLIQQKTGVSVGDVGQTERDVLLNIEDALRARVIGQSQAIHAISAALRRARAGLNLAHRPLASFLFLGPTGVGKTELAKATADTYFGGAAGMIRFDMSEYQSRDAVERFIGRAGEAGQFTEALRLRPFSLVLIDEIEKAHPDVLNLFLQVMDDGRITDGLGRTIDCTSSIFIATSNVGAVQIQDSVVRKESLDTIKASLMDGPLRETFHPEFLNRFTDIIVFSPLSPDDVVAIAYLHIAKLVEKLAQQNIVLDVSDDAVHALARLGYDPKFGARPLQRAVQERLENPIADIMLRNPLKPRDSIVVTSDLSLRVILAS